MAVSGSAGSGRGVGLTHGLRSAPDHGLGQFLDHFVHILFLPPRRNPQRILIFALKVRPAFEFAVKTGHLKQRIRHDRILVMGVVVVVMVTLFSAAADDRHPTEFYGTHEAVVFDHVQSGGAFIRFPFEHVNVGHELVVFLLDDQRHLAAGDELLVLGIFGLIIFGLVVMIGPNGRRRILQGVVEVNSVGLNLKVSLKSCKNILFDY